MQAERAHLRPQLDGKAVVTVDLGGYGRDLVDGEVAHRVAQHVDLGTEIVIEGREPGSLHALYMAYGAGFDEGRTAGSPPPPTVRRPAALTEY